MCVVFFWWFGLVQFGSAGLKAQGGMVAKKGGLPRLCSGGTNTDFWRFNPEGHKEPKGATIMVGWWGNWRGPVLPARRLPLVVVAGYADRPAPAPAPARAESRVPSPDTCPS